VKQPKIAKPVQELINQTQSSFIYHCIGKDKEYNGNHYMNIFAIELVAACCDMMDELKYTHSSEDAMQEIKKHFGVIQ
jgi:hypothetical protein